MSAPTLIPVDHSLALLHSFDVYALCRCGDRVHVGRIDQTRGGRLWNAYEPDGTMAGTVSTPIMAERVLIERAGPDHKEKNT